MKLQNDQTMCVSYLTSNPNASNKGATFFSRDAARCNVHLQTKDVMTPLKAAESKGHVEFDTMIRNRSKKVLIG